MDTNTPNFTSEEIRAALIQRAEAFGDKNGMSLSSIGLAAVKDAKFLHRVKGGKNFNIDTYQRVVEWLSEAEKAAAA